VWPFRLAVTPADVQTIAVAALVGPERLTALREALSAYVVEAGSPPIRPLW
jgi:hypothetical protein